MVRIVLLMMTLVFVCSASAEAGWLDDKLKQAAESVGNRAIDDASNSAYEGAKDSVNDQDDEKNNDPSGQYDSEKAAGVEEQPQGYPAYSSEPGREEMGQPSWADSDYGQKKKKKKRTGPPRTDLHLSTEMIMIDPEMSPEPTRGDIYIDGTRTRTEWKYADGNKMGIIITGIEPADKVYILMHSEKTYMESSVQEDNDSAFTFDSSKPCEGFRKAEDLGSTILNGRSVAKWRCSEPEDPEDAEEAGSVMTLWYDKKLKIPVRMEDDKRKSSWELVNIREGKPSGDLFKVPADYKKFSFEIPSRAGQ